MGIAWAFLMHTRAHAMNQSWGPHTVYSKDTLVTISLTCMGLHTHVIHYCLQHGHACQCPAHWHSPLTLVCLLLQHYLIFCPRIHQRGTLHCKMYRKIQPACYRPDWRMQGDLCSPIWSHPFPRCPTPICYCWRTKFYTWGEGTGWENNMDKFCWRTLNSSRYEWSRGIRTMYLNWGEMLPRFYYRRKL